MHKVSAQKRILNSPWIVYLFLLGLFSPGYINRFRFIDIAISALKFVAAVVVLLYFVENIKRNLKKKFNVLLIILTIELLFSTLISGAASVYFWLIRMISVLIICFLFEELMSMAPYNGLRCLYIYFSLITLINTITIFVFPNAMYQNNRGLWRCWFLGEDNGAYFYYILASTFAMLYCDYITKRITLLAMLDWVGAFVFVFHNDIATGKACQIIWLILVVGYQFKYFRKLLKARYALYIMLAGFVFLVLMRKFILVPIVEALGRDITLSGRTMIWDATIKQILKKPIFGYGVCDGNIFARMIGYNGITMAHDWFLNLGFAGGIVAVIIYVFQLTFAFKDGRGFNSTTYYRCIVIGMIIVFIRAVTEGSNWEGYFIFPAMISYSMEFSESAASAKVAKSKTVRFKFVNIVKRSRRA